VSVDDDQAPAKRQKMLKKIRELIHEDVAEQFITHCHHWDHLWSLPEILTENLNMRRIAMKFVPRLSTNDKKQQHINVCLELQEKANEGPTFSSVSLCFPN
jgi:metal-dependent hydrolase (beta-lactamase superfamily II)